MKIFRKDKETASIFEAQYGIILEESASELTQGWSGTSYETWAAQKVHKK